MVLSDILAEGESPIPASLRKEAQKQKRSPAVVLSGQRPLLLSNPSPSKKRSNSDSDDDVRPKRGHRDRIKSVTPSPVKSHSNRKRSRVVVYESDDEEASPKKHKKKGPAKQALESGDDEDVSLTLGCSLKRIF